MIKLILTENVKLFYCLQQLHLHLKDRNKIFFVKIIETRLMSESFMRQKLGC